jgi:peptidyl-tRNA hydrolase, PTH1 family
MTQTKSNSTQLVVPQLIVGLGNPEPKYDKTRHNIGFEAVDAIVESWRFSWQQNRRFQGVFAEGNAPGGSKVRLLKPLTYMNRSGQSVQSVVDWYKIPAQSILVIYDDMDLPLGKLRLRLSGSAGGHNGMKSIISHLGNNDRFPRLRIGIGKSDANKETISHVLGKFTRQETQVMSDVLKLVTDAIELSLTEGVEKAMSIYNAKNAIEGVGNRE